MGIESQLQRDDAQRDKIVQQIEVFTNDMRQAKTGKRIFTTLAALSIVDAVCYYATGISALEAFRSILNAPQYALHIAYGISVVEFGMIATLCHASQKASEANTRCLEVMAQAYAEMGREIVEEN
ncbi:hypothetical protein J4464_04690 [Candidatus Woesearchaeota archaeon]|nr:hypothetical protein [Candidatus Woesearchaeota archaeon]